MKIKDLNKIMKKSIHIYYINKIKECKLRIFEEEDNDYGYVNYHVIGSNNRAIKHYLDKAEIINNEWRKELLNTIEWYKDNCVEELEKKGWTILKGTKNL